MALNDNVRLIRIFRKIVAVSCLGILGLVLACRPSVAAFADPVKVAESEVSMWKSYYSGDSAKLREALLNLIRQQCDVSERDAARMAELFQTAAVGFSLLGSDYRTKVLPVLTESYAMMKDATGLPFDPKEAADAELGWWVARRNPQTNTPDKVGKRIAHLYSVLFGKTCPEFDKAGYLRAKAAHVQAMGGRECDWNEVRRLLIESYTTLRRGL